MDALRLVDFHRDLGGRFTEINGLEAVADYGDTAAEHLALGETAGVLDLSFRGRLCLTGADRVRFLHGQVTNDIKRLAIGEGCYAALVTAKGRMQSDLNIYALRDELLLDFEPGLAHAVAERLRHYIVADDVEVIDVAPHYGLLSVQGPRAGEVLAQLGIFPGLPAKPLSFVRVEDGTLGELYAAAQARSGSAGFDLFVPAGALGAVAERLVGAARSVGGRACGWQALEVARIEAGLPRYGLDMDETNLPQECGIESRALNYHKGCYIGQEVLNRIHTIGHVNRQLCGMELEGDFEALPQKGDRLFVGDREAGALSSVTRSPKWKRTVGLGYVRREFSGIGTGLTLRRREKESVARVVGLPFQFGG